MSAFAPAYGVDPSKDSDGPQCSSTNDFCFFCEFEPDPDQSQSNETDYYTCLTEFVSSLADQNKELIFIVDAVYAYYTQTVKPRISWKSKTGQNVCQPVWTKDSIRRHLLHSGKFPSLFDCIIRNIFHSIIIKHNETMIDAESGAVVDEHRKAFLETVAEYRKWSAAKGDQPPSKKMRTL